MTLPADAEPLLRKYALQNALQHGGQANPKAIVGKVLAAEAALRPHAKDLAALAASVVPEVNALGAERQREELASLDPSLLERKVKQQRVGLKPLPGTDEVAKVVLRFAPNPNGPLSIGHARGVAVMAEYARMYDAELILRFDDTDPQVKPPLWDEARGWNGYDMIREDFSWLAGKEPAREVLASDRVPVYYEGAKRLIERGGAYVCTCDAEAWRALKNQGQSCEHRSHEPERVGAEFEKMIDGEYEAGQAVLRVKTDIEHPDPALRDWTAFRVVSEQARHPRERAGLIPRYRCWPLLDFESAIEDHEQGVTHIVRGKDLMDSTKKQRFLYDHMGWAYPQAVYWGRVRIHEFGKFSTSGMRKGIEEGVYEGWDDPRLPTLRALARRGFDAQALRAFWITLGVSEKDIALSMLNVESANAKALEAQAPRFFFVPDPVPWVLNGAAGHEAKPLLHPPDESRGRRSLPAETDIHYPSGDLASIREGRVRLKDLGNVRVEASHATFEGNALERGLPVVQWLPASCAAPFAVIRPPRPAAEGQALDPHAPVDRIRGVVEKAALERVGAVVQFERFGFVRIESSTLGVWTHE